MDNLARTRRMLIAKSIGIGWGILIFALSACSKAANPLPTAERSGNINTPIPSASATAMPTSSGGRNTPVVTFAITSSHQTTPQDILREIVLYFPGAGGGGNQCVKSYQRPTVFRYSEDSELLRSSVFAETCGWQPNELVQVTVQFPNGHSIHQEVKAYEDGSANFSYATTLDDPPGTYIFVFEGKGGSIEQRVSAVKTTEPRVYKGNVGRLFLYNFEPNEHVRVFVYREIERYSSGGILVAWEDFQVGSNGQLIVEMQVGGIYAVIGDVSGEVTPFGGGWFDTWIVNGILFPAYIEANTGNDRLNVRKEPGTSYQIVAKVISGTRIRVTGQPRKDDGGTLWWPVRLDNGTEGWAIDTYIKRVSR